MKKTCLYTYTHNNCKDIWDCYFGRLDKHFFNVNSYVISNEYSEKYANHEFIKHNLKYNNYTEEYLYGLTYLKLLNYEFIINSLEDFILYNNVNLDKINEYIEFLKNSTYDFIRLIKSTDIEGDKISNTLFKISEKSNFLYSMQTTLWKIDSLIKIYENSSIKTIRDEPKLTKVCLNLNINGCYHYDGENQRGLYHSDSNVYPYMATALVLGKWNLEYKKEMEDLQKEYNLDFNKRK